MHAPKVPIAAACPVTHILAASRYAKPSHYVVGSMGVEFSVSGDSEVFKIDPVFDLSQTPWSETRVDRLIDGVWLIHPEKHYAGLGLFVGPRDAQNCIHHMGLPMCRMETYEISQAHRQYLSPFWHSVDAMQRSFYETSDAQDRERSDTFTHACEIFKKIQHAKKLYGVCRMRENHPYWQQ